MGWGEEEAAASFSNAPAVTSYRGNNVHISCRGPGALPRNSRSVTSSWCLLLLLRPTWDDTLFLPLYLYSVLHIVDPRLIYGPRSLSRSLGVLLKIAIGGKLLIFVYRNNGPINPEDFFFCFFVFFLRFSMVPIKHEWLTRARVFYWSRNQTRSTEKINPFLFLTGEDVLL